MKGETPPDAPEATAPTARDLENAAARQAIAERQAAEYTKVLLWATSAFGPYWLPSHRHYLVEKEEEERARREGGPIKAAATVYTVKNAAGDRRHFTVDAEDKVTECAGYEAGFGEMILEPHPTRGFMHKGQFCRTHRYSLCFAPYELYTPKTAEQLAALRETRGRKKEERADAKFAEENPLFAQTGMTCADFERAIAPKE